MTKANGRLVIQMFFTLFLLSVPASSQEPQRDAPPTPSPQHARTFDAQEEKAAEQGLWDSIKNGSDPQEYKTFLMKYPRGRYAGEARGRLGALLGEDYVTLFTKRIDVNQRWSNVEKLLGRRADIIPKLYETLHAAGVMEMEFYGQVAEARSHLLNATYAAPQGDGGVKTPEQRRAVINADNGFTRALKRLDSLPESYPQLRSNEKLLTVQDELAGVENRITVARVDYNNAVTDYNATRRETRMAELAERHGFAEEPYFKSEPGLPVEPKINSVLPATTHLFSTHMGNIACNHVRRA